ncbi:MAG TPA: cold shock domain-containing protein [Micromonospora sp.]
MDRFDHDRGYGFITVKGGPRVFVHATAIDGAGEKVLHRGQWVALDIRENPRGPRAHNVRPL